MIFPIPSTSLRTDHWVLLEGDPGPPGPCGSGPVTVSPPARLSQRQPLPALLYRGEAHSTVSPDYLQARLQPRNAWSLLSPPSAHLSHLYIFFLLRGKLGVLVPSVFRGTGR